MFFKELKKIDYLNLIIFDYWTKFLQYSTVVFAVLKCTLHSSWFVLKGSVYWLKAAVSSLRLSSVIAA